MSKQKSQSSGSIESVKDGSTSSTSKSPTLSQISRLDPDKFVESYGHYGKYQIFTYILVQTLNFFYSSSIYVMSYVQLNLEKSCSFRNETALEIDNTCGIRSDENRNFSFLDGEICGMVNETKLEIKKYTPTTHLLLDFNLECSHFMFQELGLTVFTIGAVLAVPIMSIMADRFGRRPIIVASAVVAFIANVVAAFSPNYAIFLVLRMIIGAASDTYLSVGSVATCEYISEKARAWITVVYNVAWSAGMIWTLLVTFMTDAWRWRYFLTVAPGVYAFFLWFFLPESPHWLIVHKKTDKLKKYIKISNRFNDLEPDFKQCKADGSLEEEHHESCSALCSSPQMIWRLFANGFLEFVISLVYFAISFLAVELGSDHSTAFFYSSAIEIPAGLLVLPLMINYGRRPITLFSFLVMTLSLFGSLFVLDSYFPKLVFLLIAKVAATIIYTVHPIWANEQFPTSVRSLSFSIMNIPQSVGIILSPYLKHVEMQPIWLPFSVITLMSAVGTVICGFLEETRNCKMPARVKSLSRSDISLLKSETPSKKSDKSSSFRKFPSMQLQPDEMKTLMSEAEDKKSGDVEHQ